VPALLAAVTNISDAAGTEIDLTDIEQMRIGTGLTVTRVTSNGPPYVLIAATVVPAPDVLPLILPAYQPANASLTAASAAFIAFAPGAAPCLITQVEFIPLSSLTANNTNFRTIDIWDFNEAGSPVGSSLYSGTTKITGTNASGDWNAGVAAFTAPLVYALASGHRLVAMWGHGGAGIAFPDGAWRVT
jgi:hypothetical protein